MDLAPNQLLMGHYLTDDLATTGWGSTVLDGLSTVATDITPDELALYNHADITAFRVGLTLATDVSRVFVIPVTPDGELVMSDMVEWECSASSKGWNLIELPTPYNINLPEGYSLRIGFDYVQATKTSKPLSVVKVGTIYPTYHLVSGEWRKLVLTTKGNLSLQCVVESDNFPKYVIRVRNLSVDKTMVKAGTDVAYAFETVSLGSVAVPAGGCTYEVALDGNVIETLTNPQALGLEGVSMGGSISTDGLAAGRHYVTVTPTTANGETIENPTVFETSFVVFDYGFERQMHLVEQFTSTNCTYCPQGTANILNLTNMRNDIAWVCHHEYMSATDPFQTEQVDSLPNLQGIDGYPEATFDRTAGISSAGKVYAVITSLPASTMSGFLDYVEGLSPAWATVNVNSTYDASTRKAVITINGDLVPGFDDIMGKDAKLTVFITEDNLVAPQYNQGQWVDNYVHNNVTRMALGSVKGVAINKVGDNEYKNEFTVDIPAGWNADNLNLVAFISRPLGNKLTDIYVTNCNKRKFGEFDEPAFIKGDVNGDQNVDIVDVTRLIDYVLTGVSTGVNLEAAECDGFADEVNIGDIVAIINYVLTGQW